MSAATADWLTKDFYAILGVPQTATAKQITRAYRKLARELHPDTRAGEGSDERFKDVSAAYAVLGDEAKRQEYDELRLAAAQRPSGWTSDRGGYRVRVHDRGTGAGAGGFSDANAFGGMSVEDLLSGRFADYGAGGTVPPPRRPRRGQDLQTTLRLSFEQAVHGTLVDLPVDQITPCAQCWGTGARAEGTAACPACQGAGVQHVARTVSARIPAGVCDGQTVRLPGRGDPGSNGGPAGDLLLQVQVDRHPVFGRDGRHLTVTVPVTFPEAALGADISVPTLDKPVTVRIPPGTASGTTLRVRGHGVPPAGGTSAGDLLVTVQVQVPSQLSSAQRTAVEQLAAASTGTPRAHLGVESAS